MFSRSPNLAASATTAIFGVLPSPRCNYNNHIHKVTCAHARQEQIRMKSARTKAAPHPFGSLGHPTGVHSHYEYRPGGRDLLTSNIMSSARTLDKNKISNRRESNS